MLTSGFKLNDTSCSLSHRVLSQLPMQVANTLLVCLIYVSICVLSYIYLFEIYLLPILEMYLRQLNKSSIREGFQVLRRWFSL